MDYMDLLGKFANQYVEDINRATIDGDWETIRWVKQDADRIVRDLRKVINAVDFLTRLGLTVK